MDDTEMAAELTALHPTLDADTIMLLAQRLCSAQEPPRLLMTTAQAAERLGVKRQWVWRLVQTGRLAATKHGRDWLIGEADLERLPQRTVGRPRKETPEQP